MINVREMERFYFSLPYRGQIVQHFFFENKLLYRMDSTEIMRRKRSKVELKSVFFFKNVLEKIV